MAEERSGSSSRPIAKAVPEVLLALAVVVIPLLRGGVDPVLFVGLALLAALLLGAMAFARRREGVPCPPVALALAGGAALALLSTVPLPAGFVRLLSPRAVAFAVLPPETPPSFVPWSLDPPASLLAASRLAALAGLVAVSAALARRERSLRQVAAALAASGLVVGGVALAHLVAGFDRFFGAFPVTANCLLPSPFVDANHAASLYLLSTLACLGFAVAARSPLARFGWAAGAVAGAGLVVSTLSHGGIGALVLGIGVFVLLLRERGAGEASGWWRSAAWILACVACAALLASLPDLLEEQGHELPSVALGKSWPWAATLRLVAAHPLLGVGAGAFEAAFPAFAPPRMLATVTHPENVLLQWSAEWGLPATVLALAALAATLGRAARERRASDDPLRPIHAALVAAVLAVLLHDFVDFGLEFAGVGVPFAVAVGLVSRRGSRRWQLAPMGAAAGAVALVGLSALAVAAGLPRLVERELGGLAAAPPRDPAELDRAFRAVRAHHPVDAYVALGGASALLDAGAARGLEPSQREDALLRSLPFLARSQELSTGEQPHLLTARALRRLGRRPQAFTELRLAFALGGNTPPVVDEALRMNASGEELASLARAARDLLATAPDERPTVQAAPRATQIVAYLRAERGLPGLARATARSLLEEETAPWSASGTFLAEACRAAVGDAHAHAELAASAAEDLEAVAKRLRASVPDDAGGFWCGAQARLLQGDLPGARLRLEEGVRQLPADLGLRAELARLLLDSGSASRAAELLEPIRDPVDPAATRSIAELKVAAFRALGRHDRAVATAAEAAQSHASETWARRLFAAQLEAEGQYRRASDEAGAAAQLTGGTEREELLAWSARLLARAGEATGGLRP